jgi:hypothetical protein
MIKLAPAYPAVPPKAGQPQAQRFTVKDRKRAMTTDRVEKASWADTHQISGQKIFRKVYSLSTLWVAYFI